MKRPLCLLCLIFTAVLVWCMRLMPMPVPDYGRWDGQRLTVEGQVYQKEYRSFTKRNNTIYHFSKNDSSGETSGESSTEALVLYLTSIHISNDSINIPQNQLQNIMCYMEAGTEPPIGSRVRVEGVIQCFSEATNPGEFDMRRYHHIMKLDFKLNKASVEARSVEYSKWREGLYLVKKKFTHTLERCFSERDASIMKAMLLGDTGNLDKEIKQLYQQSGIIHILSISGLHISMIGMGIYRLFTLCRIPGKVSAVFCIIVICGYGIMTGMGASAVRAIIMFGLHLSAKLVGRTYDMLTALMLAAVLLLVEQPRYVEHSGFLFSFSAIAALGLLVPVFRRKEKRGRCKNLTKVLHQFYEALLSGIVVALIQLPVHLFFYYQFPLYSIFLNLLIIPLATIVMYNGMFCMLAGGLLPWIGKKAAYLNAAILWIYEESCILCQKASYGNYIVGKPQLWQVEAYILLMAVLAIIGKKMSGWWKLQWVLLSLSLLVFRGGSGLSVTAIDVGQGDSIHIRSDMGKNYLIDGGSTSKTDVGSYQILPYLKSQGVGSLDAVFVTHADEDHCNGIATLIEGAGEGGIDIRCLILPDVEEGSRNERYRSLKEEAEEKGIIVKYMSRGQQFTDGSMKILCMHPEEDYHTKEANEYSLVLYLTYGSFQALFTGDVEGAGEEKVKGSIRAIREEADWEKGITLLKVAHHGSKYSTDEEILELLQPKIALISCGENNRYGHPHEELLERLEKEECDIYMTKEGGAITVWTDGTRMRVETFR
ncbi:DNA internalization-related competence protein ComEC/Rec2 [Kineothrix sp. MB12-C1]|uniref:DNA internalization-related competence protein ComEC/Rec2 n=1 Tax=Kineothrix sp. MB12-C1 TaxID=3070215 RepID=UPI0027D1F1EC|nr:DNA internalization-related competence protein ComEC/Rec2 [Kineothrix sp. MB12-C1]WMC92008.1 DNA internalization-related competence protein ComEC/Rec2 [Kineothrix sp. MB12-C1]